MKNFKFATMIALSALSMTTIAAPVLNTTDFITSPTNFNGFESIPNNGVHFTGGIGPYVEGGLRVIQVGGGPGNDIWVNLGGLEGNRSWYPDGGDNGYTRIGLASGTDFSDISLLFRSYDTSNVQYELFNDGISVLSGFILSNWGEVGRIGFSGGEFDEVLLRSGTTGNFGDSRFQALQIDSIKANVGTVPEPGSLALLGLGLAGLCAMRRKQKTA